MEKRTSATNRPRRRFESRCLQRRGFTLVESMIASVLLSVSVVGVGGSIAASYAHDKYTLARQQSYTSGTKLMDELSTLPMDPPSSTRVGLTDFASYNDTVVADQPASAVTAKQASKQGLSSSAGTSTTNNTLLGSVVGTVTTVVAALTPSGSSTKTTATTGTATADSVAVARTSSTRSVAIRSVAVERRSTLNGSTVSTGDLAIVTVQVQLGDGKTVKLKRLVSSAEAAANTLSN